MPSVDHTVELENLLLEDAQLGTERRRPPRSAGPFGKTWPRWLSPWVDLTSVLIIPWEVSRNSLMFAETIGVVKLGHPQPDSMALLRRQSIDRLLRLSILHNEPPILCLRAERVAVSPQSTRIVLSYRSAGRSFPMRCEYSSHSGGATAATVLTSIRTSTRVARSSAGNRESSP